MRLPAGGDSTAPALIVLAAHAGTIVVSCLHRPREATHLVLAWMLLAVGLRAAGVEAADRGAEP